MKLKWSAEAEAAVARVPFFVRKRVRKRVEEEALHAGSRQVRLEHVHACKRQYLENMEEEVRGWQVETCFGPSGCPNRAVSDDDVASKLEERFSARNWKAFLKDRVNGPLKMHHEFRVSISDCPNACSRPQIADVGWVGVRMPRITEEACSRCGACEDICRERAVSVPDERPFPVLDSEACVACGQCIDACPTGTLQEAVCGYRLLLGGRLGRHPRLARPLRGIFNKEQALQVTDRCLDLYQDKSECGERMGELLDRFGWDVLSGLEPEEQDAPDS